LSRMKDDREMAPDNKLVIYVVISTFYKKISGKQLCNAKEVLLRELGIEGLGSLELPYLINTVCKKYSPNGVVALGCIIEGETTHFEVLSNAIFDKLIQISIDHDTPITSAILTVKNEQQAIERSDGGPKDRAIEAAKSLVSLIKLKREL
jgi:6,7-dimethyl-8-ribityllumazine synthase